MSCRRATSRSVTQPEDGLDFLTLGMAANGAGPRHAIYCFQARAQSSAGCHRHSFRLRWSPAQQPDSGRGGLGRLGEEIAQLIFRVVSVHDLALDEFSEDFSHTSG